MEMEIYLNEQHVLIGVCLFCLGLIWGTAFAVLMIPHQNRRVIKKSGITNYQDGSIYVAYKNGIFYGALKFNSEENWQEDDTLAKWASDKDMVVSLVSSSQLSKIFYCNPVYDFDESKPVYIFFKNGMAKGLSVFKNQNELNLYREKHPEIATAEYKVIAVSYTDSILKNMSIEQQLYG